MSKPVRRSDEQTFDEVDEQIVKNFFYVWGEAIRKRDKETLERTIADNYTFISPRGSFHNKELMTACLVEDPYGDPYGDPYDPYSLTEAEPSTVPDSEASTKVTTQAREPRRPSGTSMWFLEPQFDVFRVAEENLHSFGTTAWKTGKIVVEGVHKGRAVVGEYLFANIFVKGEAGWQVVATHMTKVPA